MIIYIYLFACWLSYVTMIYDSAGMQLFTYEHTLLLAGGHSGAQMCRLQLKDVTSRRGLWVGSHLQNQAPQINISLNISLPSHILVLMQIANCHWLSLSFYSEISDVNLISSAPREINSERHNLLLGVSWLAGKMMPSWNYQLNVGIPAHACTRNQVP